MNNMGVKEGIEKLMRGQWGMGIRHKVRKVIGRHEAVCRAGTET